MDKAQACPICTLPTFSRPLTVVLFVSPSPFNTAMDLMKPYLTDRWTLPWAFFYITES